MIDNTEQACSERYLEDINPSSLPVRSPRYVGDATFCFNVTSKLTQPREFGIKIMDKESEITNVAIGDYVYNLGISCVM